jgi:hypothetical protein
VGHTKVAQLLLLAAHRVGNTILERAKGDNAAQICP